MSEGSSHVDGPVPSTRAWIERRAARGMLSWRPAHAARRRDSGPGGSRSSSAWTLRRFARICARVRSRRGVDMSVAGLQIHGHRSALHAQLFEVELALDAPERFVVDPALIAQLGHRGALGADDGALDLLVFHPFLAPLGRLGGILGGEVLPAVAKPGFEPVEE